MEVILIIALIGILVLLISLNTTKSKFSRAEKLISKKRFEKAQKILQQLFSKHEEALTRYSESLYLQGLESRDNNESNALELFYKVIESEKYLTNKSNKESFTMCLVNAHYEIAAIVLSQIQEAEPDSKKRLNDNIKYLKSVPQSGREDDYQVLTDEHYRKLSDIYYNEGLQYEKTKVLSKAIESFNLAKNQIAASNAIENNYNGYIRSEICKLKNGQQVNFYDIEPIETKSHPFRNELIFRYAIQLLKTNNDFKEAERLIKTLPVNKNTKTLLIYCNNKRLQEAYETIGILNEEIKKIYSNELSDEEYNSMYDSLCSYSDQIRDILPEVSEQLDSLKPSLFNRLVYNSYKSKQFGTALERLTRFPQFYKSPILMKNIGNACIYHVQNVGLTENNFKHIIAMFLTSTFSDKVILHSLSETEWDDAYTFSLRDSIGSNYKIHKSLPENVNYNEIDNSNVSVGDAQRELLHQFELLLIDKIDDPKFLYKVQSFYDNERGAMESLIEIVENEITFSSPLFAKSFALQKEIIVELEEGFEKTNNEAFLQAGLPYADSKTEGSINNYREAVELLEGVVESIKKEDISLLEKYTSKENRKKIKRYSLLKQTFEARVITAFQDRIEIDEINESMIPLFKRIIAISKDFINLQYQYANYVLNLCISKVNDDSLKVFEALKLVIDVYQLQQGNARVCRNLVTLVKMNLFDIINDDVISPSIVFKEIDRIKNNLSDTFLQNSNELSQARLEFLSKLTRETRTAFLTGYNLTSDGEIMKLALDYMAMLSGTETISDSRSLWRKSFGL